MLTVFVSDVVVTAVILNTTFIRALTSLARANTAVSTFYILLISINLSFSINFTPQQSKSIIDVNVYKYIVKQYKHEITKLDKIRPILE